MRLFIIALSSLLLFGCSGGSSAVSDCYSTGQFRRFSSPSFTLFIMNVRQQDKSRVDLYLHMPFTHLRFEKSGEAFRASYSMTIVIRDSAGTILTTKESDRSVTARTYEESASSRFDLHLQSFTLSPGRYSAELFAVDNLSRLRYRMQRTFTAASFPDTTVTASSVLLLDGMAQDRTGISLRPVLPETVSLLDDSIGMFQEFYGVRTGDTITVVDEFLHRTPPSLPAGRSSFLMPPYALPADDCRKEHDSLYLRSDTTIAVGAELPRHLVRFHPVPVAGASDLVRRIIVRRDGQNDTVTAVHSVFRRDHRLRNMLTADEIAFSLRYVMREEEYDSMMVLQGVRRAESIAEFWEPRGGKARRAEFERRIKEANTLFTTCVDGAQSAMGVVYTVCGIPDYIDCRGSSIETWFYAVGERTYSIQFRRTGGPTSTFELMPYSVNESFWQFHVDRWRKRQ